MERNDQSQDNPETVDARGSQGLVYRPSGPVEQVFGTKVVYEAETAYDVRGLPNPYLGLRAYTYADRAAYAGRSALVRECLPRIVEPGAPQSLVFITGASGSGKSSFLQAGLIPALEAHYGARNLVTRLAFIHPGTHPVEQLADGLRQLRLPPPAAADLMRMVPEHLGAYLAQHTPPEQVSLLVIDQFEELFIQSPPDGRQALIRLLSNLPGLGQARLHVFATLRADYLDGLFEIGPLWELATRQGIALRSMGISELEEAIQRPLQAAADTNPSFAGKRFEAALVRRLAEDTGQDAAYLPLLGVTLEALWNGGLLKLEKYSGLAEAVGRRAEQVHGYIDFDANPPAQERLPAEQAQILGIFLDLVSVSLDDDSRRDVRRWQTRPALERGSPERHALVEALLHARLISLRVEGQGEDQVERISIIHEALIDRWDLLRRAIEAGRERLRRRARFELDLAEWQAHGGDLLSGARLADAVALEKDQDPVLQNETARQYIQLSQERFVAEQRKEVAGLRRERALRGLAAGALAFGLLALISFLQKPDNDFFILFIGSLLVASAGAPGGLVYNLGLQELRNNPRGRLTLPAAGFVGYLAFLFPLLVVLELQSTSLAEIPPVIAQAVVWGFLAGSSAIWAIRSRRPAWQRLLLASIISGLALLIGEAMGHAWAISSRTVGSAPEPASVGRFYTVVFLGGAFVQLILLLGTRLVRFENQTDSQERSNMPGTDLGSKE